MNTLSKAERIISAALNSTKNHSARGPCRVLSFLASAIKGEVGDFAVVFRVVRKRRK